MKKLTTIYLIIITALLVILTYLDRGYFAIGGEWGLLAFYGILKTKGWLEKYELSI